MKFTRFVLGGVTGMALLAASGSAALAADPVITPDPVISYASPTFNWDGFYAGVGVTGATYSTNVNVGTIELYAGANATSGSMLFGVEGSVGWARNSANVDSFVVTGEGRLGYLVSSDALIYAALGVEHYTNGSTTLGAVGGGVEFAVTQDMTIDLEYKYLWDGAGLTGHKVGASALWHF